MENNQQASGERCRTRCETQYFKCLRNTFTGCAEVIRVCRDKCRNNR